MENKSNTGLESPQSISITLYYKGFSMIVTKRDPNVSVIDLITESMKGIDWAIAQGLKPSWNDDTNKTALGEQKKSVPEATGETSPTTNWLEKGNTNLSCETCGSKAEMRTGVSKKNGKPWKAIFCSADKNHVKWIR